MSLEFLVIDYDTRRQINKRNEALRFLQMAYPLKWIYDSPDSAGPVLDLVENGSIKIIDPMISGTDRISYVPMEAALNNSHCANVVSAASKLFGEAK